VAVLTVAVNVTALPYVDVAALEVTVVVVAMTALLMLIATLPLWSA
jgi:hypothetical protein